MKIPDEDFFCKECGSALVNCKFCGAYFCSECQGPNCSYCGNAYTGVLIDKSEDDDNDIDLDDDLEGLSAEEFQADGFSIVRLVGYVTSGEIDFIEHLNDPEQNIVLPEGAWVATVEIPNETDVDPEEFLATDESYGGKRDEDDELEE
jgi:hypothetical protein